MKTIRRKIEKVVLTDGKWFCSNRSLCVNGKITIITKEPKFAWDFCGKYWERNEYWERQVRFEINEFNEGKQIVETNDGYRTNNINEKIDLSKFELRKITYIETIKFEDFKL